jgi:hypothetical protein
MKLLSSDGRNEATLATSSELPLQPEGCPSYRQF